MRIFTLLAMICLPFFLLSQNWTQSDIKIVDEFEQMEYLLDVESDSVYFINFWATWCGPCVKEMPYIEGLHDELQDSKLRMILVSLDFKQQIETRLIPYLNKNNIRSEVVLLLDDKANQWIDKVDEKWSGSIPATLIIAKGKRLFFEKEFHSTQEIADIIRSITKS